MRPHTRFTWIRRIYRDRGSEKARPLKTPSGALRLESLEDRLTPAGAFASFQVSGAQPDSGFAFRVRPADLSSPSGRVFLSFDVAEKGVSESSPDPIVITRGQSKVIPASHLQREVVGSGGSRAIVALSQGSYSGLLHVANSAVYEVRISLAGDVNGDFRVNRADILAIRERIGVPQTDALRSAKFDVDGDGDIDSTDLRFAQRNLGARTSLRIPKLVAHLAPSSDADGNRIVVQPKVEFVGQSGRGLKVQVDVGDDGEIDRTVRTDRGGRFRASVTLEKGENRVRVQASDGFGQSVFVQETVSYGDVVLDWNAVHLTAIRDATVLAQEPYPNRIVHIAPPLAARNLAMVHAAMFDAVNSVVGTYEPYHFQTQVSPQTSSVAAAAVAAHTVLSKLYVQEEQHRMFDSALNESLASVPNGNGKEAGIALGKEVGLAILESRLADGWNTPTVYVPGTEPGVWRPTEPDYLAPLLPQWPLVDPFVIPDALTFRAPPPPELGASDYTQAFEEVSKLGAFDSEYRTDEQTEIALFWADGAGTATPPGHWNRIATDFALRDGGSLIENAHTFALLNLALADAGIASWDSKYTHQFWRPITAIHEAATDGNEATIADPNWVPLLKTPPFPTYTSGHSTFSAAAAAVLSEVFGPTVSFSSTNDAIDGFTQRPISNSFTRTFASFAEAAQEASRSRVFGGIHFEFDCSAGFFVGEQIGQFVSAHALRRLAV